MNHANKLVLMINIPPVDLDSSMTLYNILNLPIFEPRIKKSLEYQIEGYNLAVIKGNKYACEWMFLILFVQYTTGIFFKNRRILDLEDKLSPVYNMASSGLKKMLVLIILYTHKSVSEDVCPVFLLLDTIDCLYVIC